MLANIIYQHKQESIGYGARFLLSQLNKVVVTVPFPLDRYSSDPLPDC
jgi:hypothetical protein